ncbi:hypothetical protein ACVWY0_001607 [Arthrobacter sp. UYNi723]
MHEGGTYAPYGYAMRDAATGEVLFGTYSGKDTGRGMIGDVDPAVPGIENWAIGMQSADGDKLSATSPGTNMSIKWAADMTTQIISGSGDQTPTIDDWKRGRLLTATDTRTNNGTKGTPSLVADVVGDWREEMLVRTADKHRSDQPQALHTHARPAVPRRGGQAEHHVQPAVLHGLLSGLEHALRKCAAARGLASGQCESPPAGCGGPG